MFTKNIKIFSQNILIITPSYGIIYMRMRDAECRSHSLPQIQYKGGEFMIINYVGRQLSVPEDFKPIAQTKLDKFDKYFRDEPTATVKLSVQKNRERVEVTITAGGMIYRGEESSDTFRNAIDLAVESIERQIRKNKTRLEKRLRENVAKEFPEEPVYDEPIIRTKEFELRPMTPEEAILQMNLIGHSFFVYSDSVTGETNVVYRRNDGDYGVIVPKK